MTAVVAGGADGSTRASASSHAPDSQAARTSEEREVLSFIVCGRFARERLALPSAAGRRVQAASNIEESSGGRKGGEEWGGRGRKKRRGGMSNVRQQHTRDGQYRDPGPLKHPSQSPAHDTTQRRASSMCWDSVTIRRRPLATRSRTSTHPKWAVPSACPQGKRLRETRPAQPAPSSPPPPPPAAAPSEVRDPLSLRGLSFRYRPRSRG